MKILRIVYSISIMLFCFNATVAAQTATLYGDETQPGNRLHDQVVILMAQGMDERSAIAQAIDDALQEESTILGGEAKSAVAFDEPHANFFYDEMVQANSLIEVIKILTEANNDKAVHTVTLGTVLYPDYAQDVFDGAALAGVMSPEDILVAVIQAGADPSTVSDAPAGGITPTITIPPLGPGVGGGGGGGGDTTASTN
ncbi:hypothetical protein KJ365_16335 [Glaciecola sp. XM2]|uniref:hypothetical protein n=1 Tax=Glaciecola sp. XM2 TaxID=1914931 RepID=UPI001BDF17DF|nr:hypothetical protein [Glaciecola sp. XM2]MBT1452452.1 hypothetical protein [Glaciecola sp. XM2]